MVPDSIRYSPKTLRPCGMQACKYASMGTFAAMWKWMYVNRYVAVLAKICVGLGPEKLPIQFDKRGLQ